MFVNFKTSWFGPDMVRYRKCAQGEVREVPDEFKKMLPKSATVVGSREAHRMIESRQADEDALAREKLADHDPERAAADATAAALKKAEANAERARKSRRKSVAQPTVRKTASKRASKRGMAS